MGHFTVPVEILSDDGSRSHSVDAMVDTGATYTCLPDRLLRDLGVVPSRRVRSELADGSVIEDDAGIVKIRVQDDEIVTYVVFAREHEPALLGAIALETALLAIDLAGKRLVPARNLKMARPSRQTLP